MSSVLDSYAPMKGEITRRLTGSLVSFETGEASSYGLFNAQERGVLFIGPGTEVYAGMVVGICSRNEDMTVNVCKKKQLTNMRAAGSDEALRLTTPRIFSLEQCLEFLADDELLECTPQEPAHPQTDPGPRCPHAGSYEKSGANLPKRPANYVLKTTPFLAGNRTHSRFPARFFTTRGHSLRDVGREVARPFRFSVPPAAPQHIA